MIPAWLGLAGLAASLALLAAVTATAAATPPKRFFGVDPQTPLADADYARMGEAGVGLVRFPLFWAPVSAGSEATYDWSAADALVAGAAANGIRALPFVLGTAPPQGDTERAAWRTFLEAAVARYGPGGELWAANPELPRLPIRDWQIWNEQNSPGNWVPRPNVRAYAKLLAESHAAIKNTDPGATVIVGGMFGTPFGGLPPGISAWDFLDRLYRRQGAERDFEGIALHPYAAGLAGVKRQIERIRRRLARAGDGAAELWITELGWASGGVAHPLTRGLSGQARRLRQSFRYLTRNRRELNLQNVTWYSWRDNLSPSAGLCTWCPESGLLTADGQPKPALAALTEFTGGS